LRAAWQCSRRSPTKRVSLPTRTPPCTRVRADPTLASSSLGPFNRLSATRPPSGGANPRRKPRLLRGAESPQPRLWPRPDARPALQSSALRAPSSGNPTSAARPPKPPPRPRPPPAPPPRRTTSCLPVPPPRPPHPAPPRPPSRPPPQPGRRSSPHHCLPLPPPPLPAPRTTPRPPPPRGRATRAGAAPRACTCAPSARSHPAPPRPRARVAGRPLNPRCLCAGCVVLRRVVSARGVGGAPRRVRARADSNGSKRFETPDSVGGVRQDPRGARGPAPPRPAPPCAAPHPPALSPRPRWDGPRRCAPRTRARTRTRR
jgi:hypothetical protein